jgi:hypothetical protein
MRTKKILKGVTPATLTDQHDDLTSPAVRLLQIHLMNMKFFRVDQFKRSKHLNFTVHTALCPSSVVNAFRGGQREKKAVKPHIYKMTAPVFFAFPCYILRKLSHCWWWSPWRYWWRTFSSPWRDWGRNAYVSCDNNTNGILHTGQTDRLLSKDYPILHTFPHQRFETGQIPSHVRFLHFSDNNNDTDITDEITDRLRKMRNLFEILNKTF